MRSSLALVSVTIVAAVLGSGSNDHGHQGYFQYANIPAYGQYEFGYNRGSPSHYTSRYEQGNNWRFRSKVRWGDKNSGYGEHYYDYNHVDKGGDKGKGYGQDLGPGQGQGQGWQPLSQQQGSYSAYNPAVAPLKSLNTL